VSRAGGHVGAPERGGPASARAGLRKTWVGEALPYQLTRVGSCFVFKRTKDQRRPCENPFDEALTVAGSIGQKADKNKSRARLSVVGLTVASAAIPVSIGLSGSS
jgi:hypothetical protein